MLLRIKTVTSLTILEEWRSRLLMSVVLFAAVSLYLGLVLTRLAVGFEERFFRDLSFALLELFSLVFVLMASYRVVAQDIAKGSILELFLVRGMRPWEYLFGRYLGVLTLVCITVFFMAGIFLSLFLVKGFMVYKIYGVSLGLLCLRLNVMVAVACFLAAVTTNQASFLVSSFLVYLSAYANGALKALIVQSQYQSLITSLFIRPMTWILPDFSWLNPQASLDAFIYGARVYPIVNFISACGYSFIFGAVVIILSCLVFRRTE